MSIDPINSARFTNSFSEVGEDGRARKGTYILDADDVDKFERKIKFNEQNVHNSTVLVGLAVLATSFVKGKSIMRSVEKIGTFAAEYVAKGAVKAADVVSHGLQKASNSVLKGRVNINPVEYASKGEKIEKIFNGLREKQVIENKAITEKFPKRVGEIFGEKTGKRTKTIIDGIGIKNVGDIIRTALATVLGVATMNPLTDNIESKQDEIENKNALNHLMRSAAKLDDIVSSGAAFDIIENAVNAA